jgi:hypothetical protein
LAGEANEKGGALSKIQNKSCARSTLKALSDWSRQTVLNRLFLPRLATRSRAFPVLFDGVEVTHARAAARVCLGWHMSAAVAALGTWCEEGAAVVAQFRD